MKPSNNEYPKYNQQHLSKLQRHKKENQPLEAESLTSYFNSADAPIDPPSHRKHRLQMKSIETSKTKTTELRFEIEISSSSLLRTTPLL